jgi:hypothetical protein
MKVDGFDILDPSIFLQQSDSNNPLGYQEDGLNQRISLQYN